MPQSKSAPRERHYRQRAGRAIRRRLAAITPDNSLSQAQCPLFAVLPAEIRLIIFQLVLSQQHDYNRPIDMDSLSPLYRPGHAYDTIFDMNLLLTCRLIYYEAQSMPLRSATHHFHHLGSTSWLYNGDIWLHHVTKRRGMDLYHLHDNLVRLRAEQFNKFFLPHLHWRRISWTICAYLLPPLLAEQKEMDDLTRTLESLVIPESCQEVNLEVETREDLLNNWAGQQEQMDACRQIALKRSDGSVLEIDDRFALEYSWDGSGQARWSTSENTWSKTSMNYRTVRLCWRARVPRRDYMSYDQIDCMGVKGNPRVKSLVEYHHGR